MKKLKQLVIAFRTRRLRVPPVMMAVFCAPLVFQPYSPLVNPALAAPWQDSQPEAPPSAQDALTLMQEQNFPDAMRAWEAITEADSENGEAWYQLGYCQLITGAREPSIESFAHAIENRFNAPAAMYNIACAYSLLEDVDQGLRALRRAIDMGFGDAQLLESDTDIDNLRDDPRFAKLPELGAYERPDAARSITISAPDGVTIYGDIYEAEAAKSAPMVLLYHQGGSNKSEYYPIGPRLNEMGFHCVAIDARSGASRFGHNNRTVDGFDGEATMLGAYTDLESALRFARSEGFTGPMTAWGSSYSSGLVLQLARDYPDDIVATLSFSIPAPRHPVMGGDDYNPDHWANDGNAAMFLTFPPNEMNPEKQAFFDSIEKENKVLFAQEEGVHGSSTLHRQRNADGWEANWEHVTKFLEQYSK